MVDNSNNLRFNKPPLFTPTFVRGLVQDAAQSETYTKVVGADAEDSVVGVTSSFKYDIEETGIKNTQQINIDWEHFENHTFFNSAQVKTNVAFDNIINKFPFDGTQKETEEFFEKLTGFEKYVYDRYPKNVGYGFFSGSLAADPTLGTWITVKDMEGTQYPQISRDSTGESKLNPELNSTTTELWLNLPVGANTSQTILNKLTQSAGGLDGFALVLSTSSDVNFANGHYYVVSKSVGSGVSFAVPKGQWTNLAILWDRTPGINKLYAYINQQLTGSSNSFELGETFWGGSDLTIGSGSSFNVGSFAYNSETTFSGALDELRLWHSLRSADTREKYQKKNVFAQDDLKLYFKFNECSGSNSYLVIDSSGNSLHGKINLFGSSLGVRDILTSSLSFGSSPLTYEKLEMNPVLFPEYVPVDDLRLELLTSASFYDDNNPNLITKLIPPHYLTEGQFQEGLETELGDISSLVSGSDPKSAKLGGTQLLQSLMYVWAKYFDEMKLYLQTFSNLNWVDYDSDDTVPDQFLQFMAKQQGFQLPPLFVGTSLEQYLDKENIQDNISTNQLSLQYIQNQIWRRILINLQDIVRSKGTLHSVKSFIRSVGIDPDNNFRIREFGGPNKSTLNFVRDKKSEISTMLDFVSGGLIKSLYLSGTRIEPGYPAVSAETNAANGYFTSGSWTYEGLYKFPGTYGLANSQSLVRFSTTGSQTHISGAVLANVVAVSSSQTINFFIRPNQSPSAPYVSMSISGVNIFDGNKWYVSVGRQRGDDGLASSVSGAYFLRLARADYGEIQESYFANQYFNESSGTTNLANLWSMTTASLNSSGTFITIGSGTIGANSSVFVSSSLNDPLLPEVVRETNFQGKISQIRFWSKFLENNEWPEHVKNFKSIGIQDPTVNFNFVTNMSGSFQRIRMDLSTDQIITGSDPSGQISIFDFSQNAFHMSGTLFPTASTVVVPEKYYYSYISPKFDEATSIDKVRPRSFLNYQSVLSSSYAQVAPLHRLELSEQPTDNTRFSIDFSIVDTLDQDMVGLFSTLDALDNILGNPELMFSPDYPKLDVLRQIYFNRLTDKINLKGFFEFYKWFDTNIGTFIAQLIPRKTKYLGTNFVIESHMFERSKTEYQFADIYLGDSNRHGLRDTILLQLITGEIRRI